MTAWTLVAALVLGVLVIRDRRRRQMAYPTAPRLPRLLMGIGGVMVWATGVLLTLPPPDALVKPTREGTVAGRDEAMPDDPELARLLPVARAWMPDGEWDAVPASENRPAHIRLADGWIVSSAGYADDVSGFGGSMDLAVWLDADGVLRGVRFLRHNETPWYAERVKGWMDALAGTPLFAEPPLPDAGIVTGATATSDAVLRILRHTGQAVQAGMQGGAGPVPPPAPAATGWGGVVPTVLFLFAGMTGALLLRRFPTRWRRRLWLAGLVLVAGVWLNRQYALVHVGMLLGWESLGARPVPLLVFLLGMPLLVVLAGNVHCGWLCPFGALQELVGDLSPLARHAPTGWLWQVARQVKYAVLLAVLVYGVWLGHDGAFGYDILDKAFAYPPARYTLFVAGGALLVSAWSPRFWCRVLCPTGACFALLGSVRLLGGVRRLRTWVPAPWVRACDLGVGHAKDLDCLCCDRCRVQEPASGQT